jgi:hypothetical protein
MLERKIIDTKRCSSYREFVMNKNMLENIRKQKLEEKAMLKSPRN